VPGVAERCRLQSVVAGRDRAGGALIGRSYVVAPTVRFTVAFDRNVVVAMFSFSLPLLRLSGCMRG
jgi:hypothetical protein